MTERTSTAPPSLPPSEPRPSSRQGFDLGERPLRTQMVVALLLGLVLVMIPLYLWRRPKTDADPAAQAQAAGSSSAQLTPASLATPLGAEAGAHAPSLSEMRILSCGKGKHGKESKRSEHSSAGTDDCDRPDGFDRLFARAITESAACVPEGSGGTIAYRADLGFARKKNPIQVSAPKDSRSLKSGKVATGCLHEIRRKLDGTTLDMRHDHTRYKVEIVATYPGAVR